MEQVLIVMTHLPTSQAADALASALVNARLVACVNILPSVQSVYRWQGKVEKSTEITLLIKTTQHHYASVEAAICAAHPYELPEVIAWPVTAGLPAYLHWIVAETTPAHHA